MFWQIFAVGPIGFDTSASPQIFEFFAFKLGESPFLGNEGPGAALLAIGDINLVHVGSDVRFALLGGRFVGEATLLRFYVLHCIAIPFVAMIFMAVHFWRIRKDGGISGPL